MRYAFAIVLPPMAFFMIGRWISGFICILLQATLLGWVPAALWALVAVHNYEFDKRTVKLAHEIGRVVRDDRRLRL